MFGVGGPGWAHDACLMTFGNGKGYAQCKGVCGSQCSSEPGNPMCLWECAKRLGNPQQKSFIAPSAPPKEIVEPNIAEKRDPCLSQCQALGGEGSSCFSECLNKNQ